MEIIRFFCTVTNPIFPLSLKEKEVMSGIGYRSLFVMGLLAAAFLFIVDQQ
jgi:hypothetical protein